MTESSAYKLHIEQAKNVARLLPVSAYELAKYAFAVNKIENRPFNPNAKNSKSSARGMMQMLIGTQKELETKYLKVKHNPDKIFNAEYAVFLGQYELARQLIRYSGNWRKAIHSYNRGSYQPNKSNTSGFASGENYANGVMNQLYKTDYAALNNSNGIDIVAANQSSRNSNSLYHQEWA